MIPLIDCSSIAVGDFEDLSLCDFNKVAQEIWTAMTGIGMCYLINHGVSKEKIRKVREVSKEFFDLPTETKLKYKKASPKQSFHGYTAPGGEVLNYEEENSTELKEAWDVSGSDRFNEKMYPNKEVPDFKVSVDSLRNDLEIASKKILRCIEICMKLEEGAFTSKHRNLCDPSIKSHSQMRLLHYYTLNPNINFPLNAIRLGEHSDWGTITLLIQDMVGGLEVKTSEGEWIPALPVENAILLNSGQLLEYWTGGQFHAAPHRVKITENTINTTEPRQSIVFFISPDADVDIFPLAPVLAKKEAQFVKFNNKPVNGYDFYQGLIEAATSY